MIKCIWLRHFKTGRNHFIPILTFYMKHILGTFELILDSMLIADTALDIIGENARQNLIGRGP